MSSARPVELLGKIYKDRSLPRLYTLFITVISPSCTILHFIGYYHDTPSMVNTEQGNNSRLSTGGSAALPMSNVGDSAQSVTSESRPPITPTTGASFPNRPTSALQRMPELKGSPCISVAVQHDSNILSERDEDFSPSGRFRFDSVAHSPGSAHLTLVYTKADSPGGAQTLDLERSNVAVDWGAESLFYSLRELDDVAPLEMCSFATDKWKPAGWVAVSRNPDDPSKDLFTYGVDCVSLGDGTFGCFPKNPRKPRK
jgi:hypothetical protein